MKSTFIFKNRLGTRPGKGIRQTERFTIKHIELLLQALDITKISSRQLILAMSLLFFLVFILTIRLLSLFASLIMALMLGLLPYLLVRIKVERIRKNISLEGESLIVALRNRYRIEDGNITEAIESLIKNESGLEESKKTLYSLLASLRVAGNDMDIRNALNLFSFSINTNWAKMVSHNIKIAFRDGSDISEALNDVLIQLRDARMLAEERKRLNSESIRIVLFLIPTLYLASIYASLRYLDIGFIQYLKNQFFTPEGLILGIGIIFFFLLNIVLLEIVMNKRLDY